MATPAPATPRALALAILAVLLAAPALAGCVQPAAPTGGNTTNTAGPPPGPIKHPGTSHTLTFAAPVQLGGAGGGEPSVRAGPDGTLWVAAPSGIGSGRNAYLWKSTDGGTTWSAVDHGVVSGAPNQPGGGDSAIAVPTAKTIYYADLWLGSVTVDASHDGGSTWTTTNPVSGLVPGEDRQWIVASGDQDAWLVYKDVGTSNLMLVTTTNGGLVWSNPQVLASNIDYVGGVHLAPDGTLFAVYNSPQGTFLTLSHDNGTTWNATKVNGNAKPTAIFPVAAVDAAGNLYVAWNAPTNGNGGQALYYEASTDGGRTWTSPVQVNPKGTTAVLPWIAAGSAGHVVLAWYEAESLVTPGAAPNGTDWYLGVADVLNAASSSGPSVAAGHGATDPVHRGQICTGGISCTNGGDRRLADFLQDTFTPSGHVVVAYADTANQSDGTARIRTVVGTGS